MLEGCGAPPLKGGWPRAAGVNETARGLRNMPPLLLELWREEHPQGQEQMVLDISVRQAAAKRVPLFAKEGELER